MNAGRTPRFPERQLPVWKRAVLKVGSSLLAEASGQLSERNARPLADFVAASRADGREIVLVSSGAVAAGRARVAADARKGSLVRRQALAALGQTRMIALWQSLIDAPVAQVLLAHDDLRNRRRYLNARNTLLELLRLGSVPVINENDTVAVEELKLGDNDNLAATAAALIDADLLLIASDVDGLYSAHPQRDTGALPIETVEAVTPSIMAMAGGSGGALGTGGMRTTLEAAQKAASAGIGTVLLNGGDADAVGLLARARIAAAFRRAADATGGAQIELAMRRCRRHDSHRRRSGAGAARRQIAAAGRHRRRRRRIYTWRYRRYRARRLAAVARGLAQYNARSAALAGRHTKDIESILGLAMATRRASR
jgi:glutamate 5-kinase